MELMTMPSWNTIWGINNYLKLIGINCNVVRGTINELKLLTGKIVVVHARINKHDELLILKIKGDRILCYSPFKRIWRKIPEKTLQSVWTGILIYSDTKQIRVYNLKFTLAITILLVTAFLSWMYGDLHYIIMSSIAYTGSMISIFYWMMTSDLTTAPELPFCKNDTAFDCRKVYTSEYSKIYDVPLIVISASYFITLYLWIICNVIIGADNYSMVSINLISAVAVMPILGYSLITQYKIKSYCTYCMVLLLLLLIQAILFFIFPTINLRMCLLYVLSNTVILSFNASSG